MQPKIQSKNIGIEASKLAGRVRAQIQDLYADKDSATWDKIRDSIAVYYDDDMADCVIEMIQLAKTYGLPPKYFSRFWEDLCNIKASQSQRRGKYAKGDMSSYGWFEGREKERGDPVWELSDKWFTLYYDHGGSGLVDGPRRCGKSLLGTNSICLPYIETYRHVVSGVYADEIHSKTLDKPFDYYHYHSSMNRQLQTAIRVKIDSLLKQKEEGVKHLRHPLIVDLIDEAALSKGKYRTASDKVMQQMYVAAIAGHLGIWVLEIHPFDTAVIWVRESVTHKFEFSERGKLRATVHKGGEAVPKIKKVWGFKSMESRIDDGDSYVRYRPYAPESFVVDVDVIAMLDFVNEQMELQRGGDKKVSEIDQWENVIEWLQKDKESQLEGTWGVTYGKMVSSLAIFYVQLERYNNLMKGADKYKPIKITQNQIEAVMEGSQWPVKRNTLAEDVVKARRVLGAVESKKFIREEAIKDVIKNLRGQGVNIDDEGNLLE